MKKINKLFSKFGLVLFVLAVPLVFAGCTQSVDGTDVNFEQKKEELTGSYGASYTAPTGKVFTLTSATIDQASKQTVFEVKLLSDYAIAIETADSSIAFYKLKDNTTNASYYPLHDGEISGENRKLLYSRSYVCAEDLDGNGFVDSGVITYLKYELNTEVLTTNQFAFIVDAQKLNDLNGNPVLNLDKNYKGGQESDSYIKYFTVTDDKDGVALAGLNYSEEEDFRSPYNPVNPMSITATQNASDPTKWDFTMNPGYPVSIDPTTAYDKTLADTMKASFKLRTTNLAGVSEDVELDWHWDTDETDSKYKATSPKLAYGTKFTVVAIKPEITAPAYYVTVYGHPGFTETDEAGLRIDLDDLLDSSNPNLFPKTVTYLETEPANIISNFQDADGSTWSASNINSNNIKIYQNALLNVKIKTFQTKITSFNDPEHPTTKNYYRWTIKPETITGKTIEFESYDDFIVTDANNNKLEIVKSEVKNTDGSLKELYIETKVPLSSAPKLWVGSGTKLKANQTYSNQKLFGEFFQDSSKVDASGYVEVTVDNTI